MAEETLLTAANRVVRFIRIDVQAHGGLLSHDTIKAANTLELQAAMADKKKKAAERK